MGSGKQHLRSATAAACTNRNTMADPCARIKCYS
ncbi:hypothetical protein A2U01_0027112 [Trifolium medium]|uniref:Uncharacterized protein n=1 Tax=Trifolium medium TaxID=97028 RepID=A0A392P243_9FABA|nr:hypothetical protein [Trifolium medium]